MAKKKCIILIPYTRKVDRVEKVNIIEYVFQDIPPLDIRERMLENGFKWDPEKKVWWIHDDEYFRSLNLLKFKSGEFAEI